MAKSFQLGLLQPLTLKMAKSFQLGLLQPLTLKMAKSFQLGLCQKFSRQVYIIGNGRMFPPNTSNCTKVYRVHVCVV